MSSSPKDLMKEKLDQLQCHFTWSPQKETIDLEDMMYRLQDSINFGDRYQATSYNQLAFIHCLQGNSEEAIQNLKEAEKILRENHKDAFERNSIVTYGNFAWVHYHMGQLAKAQSYLDKLEMICKPLTDGPRYTAMIPEVYGEKGWSLVKSAAKYYEEAKKCFEKALEKDPDNPNCIMGIATVLFRLESFSGTPENRTKSQSVQHLRRVLELDPDNSVAMVLLGLKLQQCHQEKEAYKLIEQAVQKSPDRPYVLRYAALFYRREGDMERAVERLEKAVALSPHSCFLHHQIAMCCKSQLMPLLKIPRGTSHAFQQKSKLIEKCRNHFEKAREHRSLAIKPQLDFAEFCIMLGDYSKAEEIYSHLVKIVDTRPENMQNICLQAGSFELYQKRSETKAVSHFLKGLRLEHDSKARRECKKKLYQWVDRKLYFSPHDSMALGVKGSIYQLDGDKFKAIEYFEKALEFDRDNVEYLSALAALSLSLKG
ncbi:interferon-induced protein with tetratricopeptide repeats 1-like isoform X1 [Leucoraja erinacea]|uniref:interferon-induced protein with tetratricopeptide repeats 1-like isoform X1 n=1 Tax=Leucoraja erinaceus TaxID=7782 RepID=UPI00245775B2|nr:interferon-induced protein with tetratricopeptide repeats 1-like isoform X1 [Leucoraja erinacea]